MRHNIDLPVYCNPSAHESGDGRVGIISTLVHKAGLRDDGWGASSRAHHAGGARGLQETEEGRSNGECFI